MPIPHRQAIKQDLMELLGEAKSITPEGAYEMLAKKWQLNAADITEKRGYGLLYKHEIRWARQELVIEGLVSRPDKTSRGKWMLSNRNNTTATDSNQDAKFFEGTASPALITRYERNRAARKRCLGFYGYQCKVCGLNMELIYGSIARESIHVHHVQPLATNVASYEIDPIRDMVPLCPNCHYVAHLKTPPYSVSEIQSLMDGVHAKQSSNI